MQVTFSCQQCGLIYRAGQSAVAEGQFNCVDCGSKVTKWFGRYGFSGWVQFEKRYQPVSVTMPKAQIKMRKGHLRKLSNRERRSSSASGPPSR